MNIWVLCIVLVASSLCSAAFDLSNNLRYAGWVLAAQNTINQYPIAVDNKADFYHRYYDKRRN
jgi:hypothetical protein